MSGASSYAVPYTPEPLNVVSVIYFDGGLVCFIGVAEQKHTVAVTTAEAMSAHEGNAE